MKGTLKGKIVLITGANSGIGFETSRQISEMGARVVMACRDRSRGEKALEQIRRKSPGQDIELMIVDLADQQSIRIFAREFMSRFEKLDLLINNAGILATPRTITGDGFELQLGTNHLGHFTLTGLLLKKILDTPGSRIVTVTSIAHFNGTIDLEDINYKNNYTRMGAYRRSKLANLLFAYELDRKLKSSKAETISVAVHPGITSTSILWLPVIIKQLKQLVLTSAAKGARSIIMGATSPDLAGGEYIGPSGYRQMYGKPGILRSSELSYNTKLASQLWLLSEQMTGIQFRFDQ